MDEVVEEDCMVVRWHFGATSYSPAPLLQALSCHLVSLVGVEKALNLRIPPENIKHFSFSA